MRKDDLELTSTNTLSLLLYFKYLGSSRIIFLISFQVLVNSSVVISSNISRNLSRFFFMRLSICSLNILRKKNRFGMEDMKLSECLG